MVAALIAGAVLSLAGTAGLVSQAQAAPTQRLLYVANLRGNTVSAVDPSTNTVVATIPVGSFPEGVAVSPDGNQAYVTNNGSSTVSVIDTNTNTVTSTIPVGRFPGPVAFSPDGTHAYVGRFISPGVGGVDVIDTATQTVVATVTVDNQPFGIAVTPDGSHVYVANFVGSDVSVIDAATNTVTATISNASARTPAGVAITPDGAQAYTANFNSNNVSAINTSTNTITSLIPVSSGPGGVSVTPDGADVYVAEENSNTVTVIDTSTNTVTATIPVGSTPDAVLADPAGGTAYVSNGGGNTISVLDTATNTVTATIAVGSTPFSLGMAPVAPAVTAVSPTHGLPAGGGTVTITGTHFAGASAVSFGSTPATDVRVVNDYTVTATIPAHATGTVDVTVTTPAGTSPATAADQYTYNDTTPPTTTISLAPSSPNGTNGWYTSPVGVSFSATDPDDSVAQTRCVLDPATVPASFDDLPSGDCALSTVSTDGTHTIYAASIDSNGNKETLESVTFQIDQTPPTLAPTFSPSTIYLGQTGVTASPNASDATSGVASSSCGSVDTSTAGDHTVTCTATDNAGNTASATVHYTVQYKVLGFMSPAPQSKWKAGQTVPIKIALTDVNGTPISDAEAQALASACRVTFSATGAQNLTAQCMKYDTTKQQFVYTWKLASSPTGADTITVTVTYPNTTTTTTITQSITITS
jgi:YVTN family beta-propeller protein